MVRLLFTFFAVIAVPIALYSQSYSDSNYFKKNLPIAYKDSSGLYGFKRNSKIVIPAKYNEAFNFMGRHTIVSDTTWNHLIINKKGEVVKNLNTTYASPIIKGKYITCKDSVFRVFKRDKILLKKKYYFDVPYKEFIEMYKLCDYEYKDLVLRVAFMNTDIVYDISKEDWEKRQKDIYRILCLAMLEQYWSTKWLLDQIL